MAKIDWTAVEVAYVQGTETLAQLAARLNIPIRTLERRSKKGQWPDQRAAFREGRAAAPPLEEGAKPSEKRQALEESLKVNRFLRGKAAEAIRSNDNDPRTLAVAQEVWRRADSDYRAALSELEALEPETSEDPAMRLFLEKICALEGKDFLAAIDTLLEAPPAGHGQMIDIQQRGANHVEPNAVGASRSAVSRSARSSGHSSARMCLTRTRRHPCNGW